MAQEDVDVYRASQLSCKLPLNDNDELIGNIVSIEPAPQGEDDSSDSPEVSVSIWGLLRK